MKTKKTVFSAVLCFLLMAGTLFAGGQQEKSGGGRNAEAENITLTIASSQNWIKDIDREISEDFTRETGIKIDYQVNPDNQYPQILQTKINTGEAPDIFYHQTGLELKKLPLQKVLDLSGEPWAPRMKDWARNGATIDGRLVALNLWSVDGWAFVYNTDVFTSLNLEIPNNFDELLAVCKKIKNAGITPIYEIVGDMWHTPMLLNQAIAEAGNYYPDLYEKLNTNQIKLSDIPELKECLEQLEILADRGYLGDTYMSNTWTNAIEVMGTGQYAMFFAYTSWQSEVAKDYPDSGAEFWKMFVSPLGARGDVQCFATSAGGIVSLISDGPNAEAAKKYFEYRTRPEVLEKFYSARSDINSNPSFEEAPANPTSCLISVTDQVQGNFKLDAQGGMLYFDQMTYGSEIQAMLSGAISAGEALANMDKYRLSIGKSAGQTGF